MRQAVLQGEEEGSLRDANHRYFQLASYHHFDDPEVLAKQLYHPTVAQRRQ